MNDFEKKEYLRNNFANLKEKEKWVWFFDRKLKWFFCLGVIEKSQHFYSAGKNCYLPSQQRYLFEKMKPLFYGWYYKPTIQLDLHCN